MYTIYNVVWGVQITKELEDKFNEYIESSDEEYGELSVENGGWFTTTYSGMADHEVGWIGRSVYSFAFKGNPMDMAKKMELFEDYDVVKQEISEVPEWLRKHFPEPNWMFVVSTS